MRWRDLDSNWIDLPNGSRIHYHEQGTGDPVVLVHGSGAGVSAALNWWNNIDDLSASFRVLAPDLPGFGATETPDGAEASFGIRYWADSLLEFVGALDLGPTAFVGNSLGGWVAVDLAARHPEVVRQLVLMGTGGVQGKITSILARNQEGFETLDRDDIRRQLTHFVYDPSIISDELVEARYAETLKPGALERFNATAAARRRDRSENPLRQETLEALDVPTLVIHGRDDVVIPPERSWQVTELVPNSELHIFSRCGHWVQVERAPDFNALVTRFLLGAPVPAAQG